ncbi:MAG TPA: TetR/AcrR family transcriptional regulator [Solirubrobacteraceae bacterium]|nr:TetR/AcrR family transcriptional regulator [Solirubrobacteraceae bacterium]
MVKALTPKAEVLRAAQRVFEEHGYAGATIERIAAEAGVSRVTLHRRGLTKDALLGELVASATEDYRRAMWPALTGEGTGAERLAHALEALCASAEEHMALLVALRAQTDGVFHRDDEEEEALTRTVFTEPLEKLLRDGIADGSLRDVDPLETATVLFNLVGWTYIHLRTGHGWKPERARRATLDPVLNGLLAPTTGGASGATPRATSPGVSRSRTGTSRAG